MDVDEERDEKGENDDSDVEEKVEEEKNYPIFDKGQVKGVVTRKLPGNKDVIDKAIDKGLFVTSDAAPPLPTSSDTGHLSNLNHTAATPALSDAGHLSNNTVITPALPTPSDTVQLSNNTPALPTSSDTSHLSINFVAPPPLPTSSDSGHLLNNTFATNSDLNGSLRPLEPPLGAIHVPSAVSAEQTTKGGAANDTAHAANDSLHEKEPSPGIKTAIIPLTETPPPIEAETSEPSTARSFQKDEDLPPWLIPMIGYLRGVTEDVSWQTLVTSFIAFERQQPPHGVSFMFFPFAHCSW